MKDRVAADSATDLDNSATIKLALTALGEYDDTRTGLSPYTDNQLFQSIRSFQKKNNLKADGVINPDGPTQAKIKEKLVRNVKAGNAFKDFKTNYFDMREAYGLAKGDGIKDMHEDMQANAYGYRAATSRKYETAEEACAIFRPNGLDEKY